MLNLLRLKIRKEIEELESLHRIEMNEKEAQFRLKEQEQAKTHELKTKEVVTLLKLDSEQKFKQLQLDAARNLDAVKNKQAQELTQLKENLLKEHYDKLSLAMAKLHEEGNLTTRFTQDIALKMLEGMPINKVQTKVITSGKDDK